MKWRRWFSVWSKTRTTRKRSTLPTKPGQSDPKSYAMLLEKVGTATSDPAFACHWLTEAANVWSTTLGDAHRAARALMIAIDRDPTQATPADRLAELYREKGDLKALAALLERRARALAQLSAHDPELRTQIAVLHEELGQLWQNPPLEQPEEGTRELPTCSRVRSGQSVFNLRAPRAVQGRRPVVGSHPVLRARASARGRCRAQDRPLPRRR